jgi:nucleoside-diphosphate-sugar epimerase
MHVLVIGGTRFVGYQLVWRLLAAGHRVTILNRGMHDDPFGTRVERIVADRASVRATPPLAAVVGCGQGDWPSKVTADALSN